MTSLPSVSGEPQRWVLFARVIGYHESGARIYGIGAEATGPKVNEGERIEVMPVAEHKRWKEAHIAGHKADLAVLLELRRAVDSLSVAVSCDPDCITGPVYEEFRKLMAVFNGLEAGRRGFVTRCFACDWRGPERESRDDALRDVELHEHAGAYIEEDR